MKFTIGFFLFVGLLTLQANAKPAQPNVILLMLDGVRWQEVFHGSDPLIDAEVSEPSLFKFLLSQPNGSFFLFGDRLKGSDCTISNKRMISLPAYQSIMAGKTTDCTSNSCGRIQLETMQERILHDLKLKKTDVATFASWDKIPYAVEKSEGSTFVNAGNQEVSEGEVDATTEALNKRQKEDLAPWDARKDDYTFAQAMNYLKNNKPRFLFISLNDSDELAHKGRYLQYLSTLKAYDEKMKSLFEGLSALGEYGKSTTVLITTDHGRGNAGKWTDHGVDSPESRFIWIYGKNPTLTAKKTPVKKGYTHLDIRPTVEKLLGLPPTQCKECGSVIEELTRL